MNLTELAKDIHADNKAKEIPKSRWTGVKYGLLTVVERVTPKAETPIKVLCKCECGNTKIVAHTGLVSGTVKSCGCAWAAHPMKYTRIYRTWYSMMARCYGDKPKNVKNYKSRGITVCERWHKFDNFYADMKEGYTDELTIERKDFNGNYEKSNCCWADQKTQQNNRRNTVTVSLQGKSIKLNETCKKLGLLTGTIEGRIKRGWSVENALTTPVRQGNYRRKQTI